MASLLDVNEQTCNLRTVLANVSFLSIPTSQTPVKSVHTNALGWWCPEETNGKGLYSMPGG